MASMEMREAVISEEHDDGHPKEAANRRHSPIMPAASAARADETLRIKWLSLILIAPTERQMESGIRG
jgi:hypothetical protein